MTWCATVGDAITAALDLRAKLDRQLMDEVYANRAERRLRPIDFVPHDIHTMEATA